MGGKDETEGLLPVAVREASPETIAAAAEALRAGRLVAFPTETVYGLGADATNGTAVAGIFAAKGRPRFNPLIVHVPDLATAEALARFDGPARRLAAAFWPGGLTLVLPKRADCPIADLTTAGLDTVAIRVPSHPVALALLVAARLPLAGPSANRSGHVSPTRPEHVRDDLGDRVSLILDAGPTPIGLESTVLTVRGDAVAMLRPGAVTAEAIEAALGARVLRETADEARPQSPGQLASHYAPRARLRLNAGTIRADEALLAFGDEVPAHNGPLVNLSPRGDLKEAAANLFAGLRRLDATGTSGIAVMPIPQIGLGEAINDRLQRAAAPRNA
jgi:L-threonylcarbamoyladenylate synthase